LYKLPVIIRVSKFNIGKICTDVTENLTDFDQLICR